jgi:hypothetical protein
MVSQFPLGRVRLKALRFITREWRDTAATRRAGFFGKTFAHSCLQDALWHYDERLSVDLPEHDIERADDRGNVGQHVATGEEVHG